MQGIPVLAVRGNPLAEAYERTLAALCRGGIRFRTQYDKPGAPRTGVCPERQPAR